jgi:precorrin-6B methylase 1
MNLQIWKNKSLKKTTQWKENQTTQKLQEISNYLEQAATTHRPYSPDPCHSHWGHHLVREHALSAPTPEDHWCQFVHHPAKQKRTGQQLCK